MFKRIRQNIGTFFRNLLCCYNNNETIKINISEIIKPYIGHFVDGVWIGTRTREFYRDYTFVLKNPNVNIIYVYNHKKIKNVNDMEDTKLIQIPLNNVEDMLLYNKIRENTDNETNIKYNIHSKVDAGNSFTQYMNAQDEKNFVEYILIMDTRGYIIEKKNETN